MYICPVACSLSPSLHPIGFLVLEFLPHTLVASSTILGLSQLVHLSDSLLELDVLALFVAVSLILMVPRNV